jgi:hypothetical protein
MMGNEVIWGMELWCLVLAVLLVLLIPALGKYGFFR